jgi:hypothetical protein
METAHVWVLQKIHACVVFIFSIQLMCVNTRNTMESAARSQQHVVELRYEHAHRSCDPYEQTNSSISPYQFVVPARRIGIPLVRHKRKHRDILE